jgi:hypothetical protein
MHVRHGHASVKDAETPLFAAPYKMLEELGRGGMARVYRALDTRSGQVIALKQLLRAQSAELSRQRTERFELEFQVLSQLSHPRVIEVFDYGLGEQGPYYTMELLDGGDLSTQAPVAWRRGCELAYDICSSLALLHLRRLVHRDINPRNVRCTSDGHAKLIDFGAMVSMDVTAPMVGTPPFIPPEAHAQRPLDARADLFSLGATLYFVLTGELAYPAHTLDELTECWRIKPPRPSKLARGIPAALDRLVMSLINLDPVLRPRSAFEVMQRLKVIAGIQRDEPPSVVRAYLATPALVARQALLDQFRTQLEAARAGRGRGILIAAAPGLGRTRMLEACALEAKTIGFSVLRADQTPGLGLLHGLTRDLQPTAAAPEPPLSSSRVVGKRHDQLSQLLRWVSRISRQFPLLIVVDDCEQLDDESLGVLCKLAQRSQKQRVVLLLAGCEDRTMPQPAGIDLLKSHCELSTLPELSLDENGQLLASVFGDVPNLALLNTRIYELSNGNPRETLGLAKHLIDREIVRYDGGCWSLPQQLLAADLPHSTRAVLQLRCAQLSALARALAEAHSFACDEHFTRNDYALIAPEPQPPEQLDATLEELIAAGVIHLEDGRGFKLSAIGAGVLHETLSAPARRSAYAALAQRSQHLGRHAFETARYLLLAGELQRGVQTVLRIMRHARSREQMFGSSRLRSNENGRVLKLALEAAIQLGRRAREVQSIRHVLLLVSVATEDDFYSGNAPAFREQVVLDSGLHDYRQLSHVSDPAERVRLALTAAAQRHAALPEHERVYSPQEAIRLLTHFVALSMAEASRRYDMHLAASLPALLEPFAPLSPLIAAVRENTLGVLEATLHRQPERAARRWRKVYEQLGDMPGQDRDLVNAIRFAVAYGLGICYGALGMRAALDWVDVLDQEPLQRVNAMYIRKIVRLQHGDLEGAERYRRQAELLSLQARARQMFSHNINLELGVHAAAWDLTGLRQVLARIEPLAERYSGWVPFRHLGQGHYLRIVGDLPGAERAYRSCIALSEPDPLHPLRSILAWPLAVAGLSETLLALDRAEEAHALAADAYARSQQRQMRATVFEVARILGLAETKIGRYAEGAARIDEVIAQQCELGVSGLNLGASYEARARAAIWAGDTAAVERYAALAAQQYRYGQGSMLGVRYERLMEEAQMSQGKGKKTQKLAPTTTRETTRDCP